MNGKVCVGRFAFYGLVFAVVVLLLIAVGNAVKGSKKAEVYYNISKEATSPVEVVDGNYKKALKECNDKLFLLDNLREELNKRYGKGN